MRRDPTPRTGLPAAVPMMQLIKAGFLWAVLLSCPLYSAAHEFSIQECVEASDFIKNTARARDHGVDESAFLNKIREDIEVIQAFPAHLRWFVQDEEDAAFLLAGATVVFQKPRAPHVHQSEFFVSCLSKAKTDGRFSSGL